MPARANTTSRPTRRSTTRWMRGQMLSRGLGIAALLAGIVMACHDGGPTGPGSLPATTNIQVVHPATIQDTVGRRVLAPLSVKVTTATGDPISGVRVSYKVVQGDGALSSPSSTTGKDGIASVQWTLGITAGLQRVQATIGADQPTVEFRAQAANDMPATIVMVSGSDQMAPTQSFLSAPLKVKVQDRHGNPAVGVTVFWIAGGGVSNPLAGTAVPGTSVTDTAGVAQAQWRTGDTQGFQVLDARVAGLPDVSFTTTVVARFALTPAHVVLHGGNNQIASVGQAPPIPYSVLVTNQTGFPVQDVPVLWTVEQGGGRVLPENVRTNADGLAITTHSFGAIVGPQRVRAVVVGLPDTIRIVGQSVADTASRIFKVSGDGQSGMAGQALAQALVVRSTDAFGNPVSGLVVGWRVTAGGGTLGTTTSITDSLGLARTTLTLGTLAGSSTVVAQVGSTTLTFTATSTADRLSAPLMIRVRGDSQAYVAGQTAPTPLTVRLTDRYGNFLVGDTIRWTTSSGTVSAATSVTDPNGEATILATLPAGVGTTMTVTATAPRSGGTATFTLTAITVRIEILAGDQQSGAMGALLPTLLQVRVTDQTTGAAVPGLPVMFAIATGGGSVYPARDTTDASGMARTQWILGMTTGPATVTATVTGVAPVTFHATVTGAAGESQLVAVSGDAQVGTANQTLAAPFVVRAQNASGAPVVNATVQWRITSLNGGALSAATTTTDASGTARVTGTLPAALNSTFTVQASIAGLGTPVTFTARVTSVAGTTQLILVSGSGQTGAAGQVLAAPFVVRLQDGSGSPVAGVTVQWQVTSVKGGSLNAASTTTAGDGQTSVAGTLPPNGGDQLTVTATVAGVASPVTFVATAQGNSLLLVSGNNQIGTANQATAAPLVVRVLDATGTPVPNVAVQWTVESSTGGTLSAVSTLTAANGTASTTPTLPGVLGAMTIKATAAGIATSVTFTATATSGSGSTTLIMFSGNNQSGNTNQQLAPLMVRVLDGSGTPVGGVTVNWRITSVAGGTIAGGSSPTASGTGIATMTATLPATPSTALTVEASLAGIVAPPVSFTATTYGWTGAASLALVSGNTQTGQVNQALAAPFVVRARDAAGAALVGVTIQWQITSITGGSLSATTSTTDAAGLSSVVGTVPGAPSDMLIVTATLIGVAPPVTFTATAIGNRLQIVSGNNQAGNVGQTTSMLLVVRVVDNIGQPVAGANIQWMITSLTGGTLPASVTSTAADGTTSTLPTLPGVTGAMTVTATIVGTTTSVTFTATATSVSGPRTLTMFSGNNQSGNTNQQLAPLMVRVLDGSGTPLGGITVDWRITSVAGGTITGGSSPTASGTGIATMTATLPATPSTALTVEASVVGIATPVSFTATTYGWTGVATLDAVSGNTQTGPANQALAAPFVVRARDAAGAALVGVTIQWQITSIKGGSLSAATSTTDAAGLASVTGTVPGVMGDVLTVTATLSGAAPPVTFTATASGIPTQVIAVAASNGLRVFGDVAPVYLKVSVIDADGALVRNVTVNWRVTNNGPGMIGDIAGLTATSVTDSGGLATIRYTNTAGPGNTEITASVAGVVTPATITRIETRPGEPTGRELTLLPTTDNQVIPVVPGVTPRGIVVTVSDRFGVVPGVRVQIQIAGGAFSTSADGLPSSTAPMVLTTNVLGQVTVYRTTTISGAVLKTFFSLPDDPSVATVTATTTSVP